MCGHYKECYKAKDTGVITSVDRWCAPGTYTDPEDIRRGAPCTSTSCDEEFCNDCNVFPTVSTPEWSEYSVKICYNFKETAVLEGAVLLQVIQVSVLPSK